MIVYYWLKERPPHGRSYLHLQVGKVVVTENSPTNYGCKGDFLAFDDTVVPPRLVRNDFWPVGRSVAGNRERQATDNSATRQRPVLGFLP